MFFKNKPMLYHEMSFFYSLIHFREVVLACGISMVTENVGNKIFTMKSIRTGILSALQT